MLKNVGRFNFVRLFLFTFILFFTTRPNFGYGQINSSNFEHFTVKDGLPSNHIYNCLQDRQGFMWIGTDAGVSRFDGKTFVNFTTADDLGDNEILQLFEDQTGRIWFIPFYGDLSYYKNGKIKSVNTKKKWTQHGYNNLSNILFCCDEEGNCYISMMRDCSHILRIDTKDNITVIDLSPEIKQNEYIIFLYQLTGEGIGCITTNSEFFRVSVNKTERITPYRNYLNFYYENLSYNTNNLKNALFHDKKNFYLLKDTTFQLLTYYRFNKDDQKTNMIRRQSKYHNAITDRNNNLFISDFSSNTTVLPYVNGKYGLPIPILQGLFSIAYVDYENNLWLSTQTGLFKTNINSLLDDEIYQINGQRPGEKIYSLYKDSKKNLWYGYEDGWLIFNHGDHIQKFDLNTGIGSNNNRIIEIAEAANNDIVVVTQNGTFVLRKDHASYKKINMAIGASKGLYFDNRGSIFVTCSFGYSYNLSGSSLPISLNYKWKQRTFCNFITKKNVWYSSTSGGLIKTENGKSEFINSSDPRISYRIKAIVENKNGILYMATYNNGLIAFDGQKVLDEMPHFNGSSVVSRRLYLRNDTLYLLTSKGLAILTFDQNKFRLIKLITANDGLFSSDTYDLIFKDNSLLIATSEGICRFNFNTTASAPSSPPNLVLYNVKINDKLYSIDKIPPLDPDIKLIRINFIAPVSTKPDLVLYRYKTHKNQTWQTTNANYLEFANLAPGKYNIEIQAKKYNSLWSQSYYVAFEIVPPIYAKWWFICLMVLFSIAIVTMIVRNILNRRFERKLFDLKQKEAIEEERKRIASDLHDDIGAELTHINLLSQIMNRIPADEIIEKTKIIQKLEQSSSEIAAKLSDVVWTLKSEESNIEVFAEHLRAYSTSINETGNLRLHYHYTNQLKVNYLLAAYTLHNLFMVVKESIQNTLKHSGAAEATLTLLATDNTLTIKYTDHGRGFVYSPPYHGNGLNNMQNRIQKIGGQINIDSMPGKGTTTTIVYRLYNHKTDK